MNTTSNADLQDRRLWARLTADERKDIIQVRLRYLQIKERSALLARLYLFCEKAKEFVLYYIR